MQSAGDSYAETKKRKALDTTLMRLVELESARTLSPRRPALPMLGLISPRLKIFRVVDC